MFISIYLILDESHFSFSGSSSSEERTIKTKMSYILQLDIWFSSQGYDYQMKYKNIYYLI